MEPMHLPKSLLPTVVLLAALAVPAQAQLQPLTWTVTSPSGSNAWSDNILGVTFGNNRFLVAGFYTGIANGARIATSPDLVSWTSHTLPPGIPPTAIGQEYFLTTAAYGNGQFLVGASGRPNTNTQKVLASSDNGATWIQRDVKLIDVWGLDYVNGLWIATGNSNQQGPSAANLATSTDGITWTLRATGSGDDLNAVAYGNGRYVAVGNNMQVIHSTDGITWTRNVTNDPDVHVRDIVFANGRFVAAGEGGRIYTSTTGLTWTRIIVAPTAIRLRGIAYGGGRFVAVGDTTTVSSADGLTWTVDTTNLRLANTIAYANGAFVIGADFGTVYRSALPVFNGPAITAQPQATSTVAGGTATFSVTATGAGLSYQWKRNGAIIAGATSATLTLTGANVIAGNYTVDINNADGTATSSAATLSLVTASNAGRLGNMSIRTNAGTGDNTLIVGLAVGGPGTSGTKPILLRGVGPTLAAFNLTGTLADPVMTVFQGSSQVNQNDDWTGTFNFSSVGAFAFSGTAPRDAAIYSASTSAGSYSIQIAGKNNGTGIALAEIYDATPSDNFAGTTPRLVNVSARTQVGTGDNILIAGFAVSGSSAVRVLIRAVGPTLGAAPFNVGGTLADPKLEIYSGSTKTIENDNWAGTAELKAAFASVAAFAFSADNSRDAALVATLQPGSYTAQISGVGNTSGVALVEIYELP